LLSVAGSLLTIVPLVSLLVVKVTGLDERGAEAAAATRLNELGVVVERFKDREGFYPETLNDVLGDARRSSLALDPVMPTGSLIQYYFYRRVDDGYHLFSMGWDGQPYSLDDVYPAEPELLHGYQNPKSSGAGS
jgi:hypothetical protein